MGRELAYCLYFCISGVLECAKYFEKKIEQGKGDEKIQVERFTFLNKAVSVVSTEKWHYESRVEEGEEESQKSNWGKNIPGYVVEKSRHTSFFFF